MVNFTAADRVGAVGGYIGGLDALGRLLGGGRGLFGGYDGYGRDGCHHHYEDDCGGGKYRHKVTEHELELVQRNNALLSENATLRSEKYTDNKIEYLAHRVCELEKYAAVNSVRLTDFERYANAQYIHQPKASIRDSLVVCKPHECCCCEPPMPTAP